MRRLCQVDPMPERYVRCPPASWQSQQGCDCCTSVKGACWYAQVIITAGATAGKPKLHKVAGFEVWLPRNDDLVLHVQLRDLFLVLECNLSVFESVKGPSCGSNLSQLVLVPLVGFCKS